MTDRTYSGSRLGALWRESDVGGTLRVVPEILEKSISCPYCNETVTVLVDNSFAEQHYVEDCQVCCQPIVLHLVADMEGRVTAQAKREND
jgi:transcription elongation factor Elf1